MQAGASRAASLVAPEASPAGKGAWVPVAKLAFSISAKIADGEPGAVP